MSPRPIPRERTDATTDELRSREWMPDSAVVYGCGCRGGDRGVLCGGHAERRALEHYRPELVPDVRPVSGHASISLRGWPAEHLDEQLVVATEYAWRSWFRELLRTGRRPAGWPAVATYRCVYELPMSAPPPDAPPTYGYREVGEDERADVVIVVVSCDTVPS